MLGGLAWPPQAALYSSHGSARTGERPKARFIPASQRHKDASESGSMVAITKPLCGRGNERVLQDLFQSGLGALSLAVQSRRNKRPLLSPFIQVGGCRVD